MKLFNCRLPVFLAFLLFANLCHATLYEANLAGTNESPSNASPATGHAQINFDAGLGILEVDVTFAGLVGLTTASHIHCCIVPPANVGVALAFVGFPLGVTSGTYSHSFDTSLASTWNGAFISASGGTAALAEANFAAGLEAGGAYLNIHTNLFPGGEIRGFLVPVRTDVPEPASVFLMALGLLGLAAARRAGSQESSLRPSGAVV